jgi:hypothetical protein
MATLLGNIRGPEGPPGPLDWTEGDTRYVNVDGDTMSGDLALPKIRVTSTGDASETSTLHGLQIGPTAGLNLIADGNEIVARDNGALSLLHLNTSGESRLGVVEFWASGKETARFLSNNYFCFGQSSPVNTDVGIFMRPPTSDGGVYIYITNSLAGNACYVGNKIGAGVASGTQYASFRLNNTTIGNIIRNGTTSAVLYNTSSDYRLKEGQGPITGALDRLGRLMPRRVIWKSDPTRQVMDGFFAHEVSEVVPQAVTGAKDAVATPADVEAGMAPTAGAIVSQQLDASQLIPLLVAAVQELTAEVAQLKAQLETP